MKIIPRFDGESRSISAIEAHGLMERIRGERDMEENSAFQSTLKYLRSIPVSGTAIWAERARKLLVEGGLTEYEASIVINLGPERHTDAKSLIPSLARIDSYALDMLFNEVAEIPN
ncbi:DNA-directed RNA polymerase II subunit RPB4 [Nematocida homosporus]|uniref:DNA-directed RNA polymerase II subunit RPB4 n=1 Tax=Nematocida homosporus TaxID=1912981 RepID=UPI002221274B|nr:DNA-directed RNA polymerase II subunit RPB4 [Nematocida homosporus]KAI5187612.1 DNA-directed RNA polymerase II subunit RPB4 [Nematocida homosporus]